MRYKIYDNIKDVNWNTLANKASEYHEIYRNLENHIENNKQKCIAFYNKKELKAIVMFSILRINILQFLDKKKQNYVRFIYKIFNKNYYKNIIFVGNPIFLSEPSVLFNLKNLSFLKKCDEILKKIAKTEKINYIVWSQYNKKIAYKFFSIFKKRKYIMMKIYEVSILKNTFESIQEFIKRMTKNRRRSYNISKKKSKDLKYVYDDKSFNNNEYQLYLNVYNKAKIKLFKVKKQFFNFALKNKNSNIVKIKKENKTIAFALYFKDSDNTIYSAYYGIDYDLNYKYDLLFNLFYEDAKILINKKAKKINCGPSANIGKKRILSTGEDRYIFIYNNKNLLFKLMFYIFGRK